MTDSSEISLESKLVSARLNYINPNKNYNKDVCEQTRLRIMVSLWAYAYEFEDTPIVDDGTFDKYSELINPKFPTKNKILDDFFKSEFSPNTGMWIRRCPDIDGIKQYFSIWKNFNSIK